ncbi:MAG: branched-chain amino acid ABC transporter permease [Alphaproteobacteria bacterium]
MLILQQLISGLMIGGIYVMVAVAFTLTIGMLNFLNFTIPALFMLSGMVAWGLTTIGVHWALALLGGVATATVASLIVERFTYRYMRVRYGDATEHALPLVSSLGFLIIFEHLVLVILGSDPQRFPTPFTSADFHIGKLVIGIPQLASLVLALAIVWGLSVMLKRSRVGRALRSIAENPDAATLMGVSVNYIVPIVFVITGLMAGIAGMLFTLNYANINAYMGDNVAAKAIAGMVIGGLGNIWGAIAGGLIVGLTEVLAIHFFGADIVKIPIWGLLLLILLIRPAGLFGHTAIGKGKF